MTPIANGDSGGDSLRNERWYEALSPEPVISTTQLSDEVGLTTVWLEFGLWDGPFLGMSEDCNKRGGRVLGDQGELSCAEVEIVKRLRQAGWQAAWMQAFKCGRRRWGQYILEPASLPRQVQRIQAVAGTGGGHPDVVAWTTARAVFLESKGPRDKLKANQLAWFERAVAAGQPVADIGLVQWTPTAALGNSQNPRPR